MLYKITIEETVSQTFEIELDTDNIADAVQVGEEKYNSGELVLEPGELKEKCIMVSKCDGSEERGGC